MCIGPVTGRGYLKWSAPPAQGHSHALKCMYRPEPCACVDSREHFRASCIHGIGPDVANTGHCEPAPTSVPTMKDEW